MRSGRKGGRKQEREKGSKVDSLGKLPPSLAAAATAALSLSSASRGTVERKPMRGRDIYEAQVTIDTADGEIPYKDCLERVPAGGACCSASREREVGTPSRDEREKEFKADASRHKSNSQRLAREFKQLQERYDALADVKERAAARYKIDYAKWRKFRDWIFTEEAEHSKDRNEVGITEEEKRSRYMASLMRKKMIWK
ncbi:hypothetical protein D9615_009304 [Tricholomella constricta]|uniref:Uncharacterized protein n=1 Tax=Tricholomella constricta TaxID=117010 RepID=A0A8H5GWQ1_9AGAR|nr:hypothetical protein D9615_009304 [Tricholomella constricta]